MFWNLLGITVVLVISCSAPLLPHKLDHLLPIRIPGFSWHEIVELLLYPLSILLLIKLFHQLCSYQKNPSSSLLSRQLLLLVGAMVSLQGQGIHLAANCIHSALPRTFEKFPTRGLHHEQVTYYLDEVLGHFLLFGGIAISLFELIRKEGQLLADEQTAQKLLATQKKESSGFVKQSIALFLSQLHGFMWFLAGVEGQTVLTVSLPVCVIILVQNYLVFSKRQRSGLISSYLTKASWNGLLFLLAWGWYFGWTWPELRVLGLGPFSTWLGQFVAFAKSLLV